MRRVRDCFRHSGGLCLSSPWALSSPIWRPTLSSLSVLGPGGGMSVSVEYLFAASISLADQAARKQGWFPHGRTGWLKPDGNAVHFLCFEEQLAIVGKDVAIYFVGDL